MTERPDLLQAQLNVEQQGIQLKYDRNQLFPELDLIGTYGFNGASKEFSGTFDQYHEGNAPFYSYGAQMTMPLSNVGPRNTIQIRPRRRCSRSCCNSNSLNKMSWWKLTTR